MDACVQCMCVRQRYSKMYSETQRKTETQILTNTFLENCECWTNEDVDDKNF